MANVSSSNGLEKRPKLRFPGFDEPYKQCRIGDIYAERSQRGASDMELLSVTMNDGVMPRSEIESKDNSSEDKSNYKVVLTGDMVYNSMRMWQGANGISPCDGIVSPAYTVLMPKVPISNGYFAAFFKSPNLINEFRRNSQGMTSDTWNLKYPQIETIKVCIPALSEQKRVSDMLGTLERRIAKQAQLVDNLKKYKRGLLRKYFITDEWNTHSQWEKCKLGVYCSKIGSGKTPRGGSSVYTDHGVMFLRSQNVLWGSLDIRDVSYIDEATNKTMLSSEVRCKDVLLNITGASIGRSCIYLLNDRANVNQHVCIIRLSQEGKERLLPEFLLQQILSDHIQQQIIDCQNGGSREGLNFQQIADFNIVLPSIKEQQVICGILNSFDQKILCEEATLNCLHTLRVSLMQQLFI